MKGTLYALTRTKEDIDEKQRFKLMLTEVSETGAVVIDGANIAADSIYTRHLRADSIIAEHIKSGEIKTDHLAAGSINADRLTANTITSAMIHTEGLSANVIKTGKIIAGNNVSIIDMANGEFSLAGGKLGYVASTNRLYIGAGALFLGELPIEEHNRMVGSRQSAETQKTAITNEKQALDARYTSLYGNVNLTGTPKTDLSTKYSNATTGYTTRYNSLVDALNAVIAAPTNTTIAEFATLQSNVATATSNYTTAVFALNTALELATKTIEDAAATDATNKANGALGSAKTYADTKVDNMEIGGRNFWLKSSAKDSFSGWSVGNGTKTLDSTVLLNGEKTIKFVKTSTSEGGMNKLVASKLEANTIFTYSFMVKSSVSVPVHGGSLAHMQIIGTSDGTNVHREQNMKYSPSSVPANKWTKVFVTFNTPVEAVAGETFELRSFLWCLAYNDELYFGEFKLEKGNKATDWTPAPEDVAAQIETKAKTFTSTPVVPYNSGDIWRNGTSVYVCSTSRSTGSFLLSEWTLTADKTTVQGINDDPDTQRIEGRKMHFTNEVLMDDAWIDDLVANNIVVTKIQATELDAGKITTGSLNASLITTGNLDAARITTGVISAGNGKSTINMSTGAFSFGSGKIAFDGTTLSLNVDSLKITNSSVATETYASIAAATAKTEAISTAATDATSKVNSIEIGGRNLIRTSYIQNRGCSTFTYNSASNTWQCVAPMNSSSWGFGFVISSNGNILVDRGRTFLVSLEVKPAVDCTWNNDINNTYVGIAWGNDNDDRALAKASSRNLLAGVWNKVWFSYTAANNLDLIDDNSNWGIVTGASPISFEMRNIQGEFGSIPTAWTPAPEDIQSQIDTSVSTTDVEYYLSTSSTSLSGGSWVTTAPAWVNGKYMWSRTKVVYNNGTTTYKPSANGTCIAGATGSIGATGTGVTSITEEYYLSTSKTAQVDGSWVTTPPTWSDGKYMWTRSKIVYSNPTSTEHTTAVVDSSWEAVNEIKIGGRNLVKESGISVTNASYGLKTLPYGDKWFEAGKQYTITAKFNLGADRTSLAFFSSGGYANPVSMTNAERNADGICSKTFTMSYSAGMTPAEGFTYLTAYQMPNTGTTNSTLEWVKIEEGNKATDWTPAPEDVAYDIEQKADSAEVAANLNIVSTAAAQAKSIADAKLNKNTYDDFVKEYSEYKTVLAAEQSVASGNLRGAQTAVASIKKEMGDMKESWTFNNGTKIEATPNGMLISDGNPSGMNMLLSQNRLSFFDGGVEVAYIADKTMKINHGIFVKSAQIGSHLISTSPANSDITIVSFVGEG